jgi:hypothetical protein
LLHQRPVPNLKLKRLFSKLFASSLLIAAGSNSYAIGDSGGGCSSDSRFARVLSVGSVAEVEAYVTSTVSRIAERLSRTQKLAFLANPEQLKTWQRDTRAKLVNGQVSCSRDFPLDYAVGHGNLEVVRWLLDLGVDPNAMSADASESIFTRCPAGGYGAPAGMSTEQVNQRRLDAYRMLLAKGANINALDPFQDIRGCYNREMLPVLKQLGARVTREGFESRVRAARSAGGSIIEANWAVVEQLAKWQPFDFRGTSFEEGLLSMLEARSNMPDNNAVVELTRRLSTIVRLSPGIVPGQAVRPQDVPDSFSPVRERCFFPEIGAYPNFEFRALWRDGAPGASRSSIRDTTDVRVGKTQAPVLLALLNNRDSPTTWRISRSNDAQVLGVIVMDIYDSGRGSQDTLSFDPTRPAYLGETLHCNVHVWLKGHIGPRNELRPYWPARPSALSYNPFTLRGEPAIVVSQDDRFVVGEITATSVMTSWPDSRRSKAPTRKN